MERIASASGLLAEVEVRALRAAEKGSYPDSTARREEGSCGAGSGKASAPTSAYLSFESKRATMSPSRERTAQASSECRCRLSEPPVKDSSYSQLRPPVKPSTSSLTLTAGCDDLDDP